MKYEISVILPIYNVDKYLRNALESIINQTFGLHNLEVIMVDDCSTDNSRFIIDEYAEKYENFIAIHLTQNSGSAGEPRNIGLKKANGRYVIFLDPDDEFMPNICETLHSHIVNAKSDIVTGNAITLSELGERIDLLYSEKYFEIIPNKN